MKAQKLRGREGINSAKIFLIAALFIFLILQPLQADTVWTEGYHEINEGDVYAEIWMYNDATADMFGGDVFQLGTIDSSQFSMFGGTMDRLMVRGNSVVNIYSGELDHLAIYTSGYYKYYDDNTYVYIYDDGLVNLHAYDVVYHPVGETDGWIDGKYIANDQYFTFDNISPSIYASHINVVPEPTTFLLFGLGVLLLRKKAGFRAEYGIQKIAGKAYLKKGLKNPCKSNCSCVKIKNDKIVV